MIEEVRAIIAPHKLFLDPIIWVIENLAEKAPTRWIVHSFVI